MTWRTRIRIALTTAFISIATMFLFATGCKYVANEIDSAISKAEKGVPTHSATDARRRGTLVAELTCSPRVLEVDGSPVMVGECWIERASQPHPHFVWREKYELLDYYWLNAKLDSGSHFFEDRNRLEFRIWPNELNQKGHWAAPNQYSLISNEQPTLPIQLEVRDRKDQEVVGKMTIGTFTLTAK
jgi:hypothetical protein